MGYYLQTETDTVNGNTNIAFWHGGDMRICIGSRVNANYKQIPFSGGAWFCTQDLWISDTPFPTHSSGKHTNHLAITALSKKAGFID